MKPTFAKVSPELHYALQKAVGSDEKETRLKLFTVQFNLALLSRAAGPAKLTYLPQHAYRKSIIELCKMGMSLRCVFRLAADVLGEEDCWLLAKSVARIGPNQHRFIDEYDMLILWAWDGFDLERWPAGFVKWISHGEQPPQTAKFPPLQYWTANAARQYLNWLASGRVRMQESYMTQKAFEKRLRSMGLAARSPRLVRDLYHDKSSNVLSPVILPMPHEISRSRKERLPASFAADVREVQKSGGTRGGKCKPSGVASVDTRARKRS